MTHLTDSKLLHRGVAILVRLAKRHGIARRQSYTRVTTRARRDSARTRSPKPTMRAGFVTLLERILRLLHKRREDRGRDTIHALHALEVECIVGTHGRCIEAPKGTRPRARRSPRFVFGYTVSLATTNRPAPGGQFVIGARSLPGDPLDGHTLAARIAQPERIAGAPVARAHVDRGHRHHDAGDLRSSKAHKQRVFVSGRECCVTPTMRREIRHRAGIEPVIGHMTAT